MLGGEEEGSGSVYPGGRGSSVVPAGRLAGWRAGRPARPGGVGAGDLSPAATACRSGVLVYLRGFAGCFPGLIFILTLTTSASKSLRAPGALSGGRAWPAAPPCRRLGLPSGAAPPGRGEAPGEPALVKNLQKQ